MSEFQEFDVNTDMLMPVTRLKAGDRIALKDSPLIELCDCQVCGREKARALRGELHTFMGLYAPSEEEILAGMPADACILALDTWVIPVKITTRVPVRELIEDRLSA